MQKSFREKMIKMMEYTMVQNEEYEYPGDMAEFESFDELMSQFEDE